MTKTEMLHVRIDPQLKQASAAVLAELGLTTGQAVRMFLRQVEHGRSLPFEVKIPNAETQAAFEDIEQRRNLTTYATFGDFEKSLGLD